MSASDTFLRAQTKDTRIEVTVFTSTAICQTAQQAHGLGGTSAVALGRLLTATGLVGLTSKRKGSTSIQVMSKSRINQLFADVTHAGAHLRGFTKNGALDLPVVPAEDPEGRRTIGPVVMPGQISVIRQGHDGQYGQSASQIISGEIDQDVEHFVVQSDQIPTVIVAETLVDRDGKVTLAAGVMLQAMPDSDLQDFLKLSLMVKEGALVELVKKANSAEELLESISPGATQTDVPIYPVWKCRCSHEKAVNSIQLFEITEIADMIEKAQPVEIKCDLCNTMHIVSVSDIEGVFKMLSKAQG